MYLNKSKTISPLIIVDPVQETRNVTAVISREKYNLFINTAKAYLKKPSNSFFIKEPFSLEKIKKKHKQHNLITINVQPLEGKRDVVGAKLLKVHKFIEKELKNNSFSLKESGWHWQDTALLYYIIENLELSKKIKHYGPPTTQKERLKHFKETWKKYSIKSEKGLSYVTIPRKYLTPEQLVQDLLKEEYISSRIEKII